ncbi:MAG: hypothetical protein NVSMB12_07830 [Acidimicrobiales bacterium]
MLDELPLLGFGLPIAGSWAQPDNVGRIARRAEACGYAALWSFQRLLYPVAGDLPPSHVSVLDSAVALAYAAAQTERIGLGTATICALLTPPLLLAKTMASLDVLSRGRLTVGLGLGWMPEEFTAASVSLERRGARMDEYLRCLQTLWTEDPVEFDGEFYSVPRSHVAPSPVQLPHPPLLLGGAAPAALRRAGRLAQGWIGSSGHDVSTIGASVQLVRDGAITSGRDPNALRIVVRGVPDLLDADGGARRRPLQGTREQVMEDLVALRAEGVTEVFFDLNLSPGIGDPNSDPEAAFEEAERVLEAFAPATSAR